MTKPRVAILGAGPAGMSAAWQLSRRGYPVTVLERDGAVGGMGKTIAVGSYAVDYGPHTFHIRETPESRGIVDAIKPLFGDDPLILTRGTRVLLRGKYYIYPLEMMQVLTGVSPMLSARIIFDYIAATVKSTLAPPRKEHSFEEWGVRNLGRTLYDLCFGIYSARVWGLPTGQISSKQAQRVAKLNLKNIILRTLGIKADPATYFTKYMYPRQGISVLYEGMAAEIRKAGGCICLETPVVALERDGHDGGISRVVFKTRDGFENALETDIVLSTLPLPALVNMMSPALPAAVVEHAAKLRYRSLKLIYIVLERRQLTDFHWVYLLDEHFRVNRVSEQKNVSPYMIRDDRTILCIELSCWKDDEYWNASDETLYRIALEDISKMGYGVTEAEVESYYVTGIPTAYPVYELDFEEHLIPVLEGVHAVPNVLTLGRHGLFLNNSMDDNVLLGMKAADYLDTSADTGNGAWLSEMLAFMNLRFAGK
ncbi:MAG TPA: FAD-dependent oxidoreductase [Vicinamibacterales bacterium]|nr:FAD-dependent oxidoreductase [Vicinamibacterales bacterium]